jgi:hypothetical protein
MRFHGSIPCLDQHGVIPHIRIIRFL